MAKFLCYAKVTATKWLGEVEAENAEEALKLANALPNCHVSVCHQCVDEIDSPEIDEIFVEPNE